MGTIKAFLAKSLTGYLTIKLIMLPVLLMTVAIKFDHVLAGALAAMVVSAAEWLWFHRRGRDPVVFPTLLGALVLFVAVLLVGWGPAVANPGPILFLCFGLGMGVGIVANRPWTASISGTDWPGSEAHPLFLRINVVISAFWALAFLYFGAHAFYHLPAWSRSMVIAAGALFSFALPRLWVARYRSAHHGQTKGSP